MQNNKITKLRYIFQKMYTNWTGVIGVGICRQWYVYQLPTTTFAPSNSIAFSLFSYRFMNIQAYMSEHVLVSLAGDLSAIRNWCLKNIQQVLIEQVLLYKPHMRV